MKIDVMSMSRNGDDFGVPQQNDTPAGSMGQQGAESQLYLGAGQDSQNRSAAAAAGANNPNSLGLGAFPGMSQGAAGNVNPAQFLEEQQRRLMLLDQAQTNQRNMLLRQSEYGQLSAARNQLMNQQMLLSQSNARPIMMDPLLSAAGSTPPMGPAVNPDMLFASGAAGNLRRQANSLPAGLLPQHAVANFQGGGGLTPAMHQQHLAAMNQMSSIINSNTLDRAIGPDMGVHDMNAQARMPDPSLAFPKHEEKKELPAKDMPIRPLSAYNFFFRDERERILKDEDDKEENLSPESLEKKKKKLLEQHLLKDRTRRRPHRKTHGKIGFTTLSKLIGKRWRELPEDKKQYYRDVAAMDMDRYQRDVAEYNKGRLFQKPSK